MSSDEVAHDIELLWKAGSRLDDLVESRLRFADSNVKQAMRAHDDANTYIGGMVRMSDQPWDDLFTEIRRVLGSTMDNSSLAADALREICRRYAEVEAGGRELIDRLAREIGGDR